MSRSRVGAHPVRDVRTRERAITQRVDDAESDGEVGAGMEAYDVGLGSAGVSLTGDESRESWPATYKVRAPLTQPPCWS